MLHRVIKRFVGKRYINRLPSFFVMFLVAVTLGACGGTRVLRDPLPLESLPPLALAGDSKITASLDHVVQPNGPGSWARDAIWYEYRLTLANQTGSPLELEEVVVIDSLDQRVAASDSRKELARSSRALLRQFDETQKATDPAAAGTLVASGVAVSALGVGTVSAAASGALVTGGAASVSGAAAAASGLLVIGPALLTTGIVRGARNAKVSAELEERQTQLPFPIPARAEVAVRFFMPIVPLPQHLILNYRHGRERESLLFDLVEVLESSDAAKPFATEQRPDDFLAPSQIRQESAQRLSPTD